jgi:2-iminobutanoate/2-iminopropanoate deaminase
MKKLLAGFITIFFLHACNKQAQQNLTKQFFHPGPGYSKAVAVTNGNTSTIYIAGLTGDGKNLEEQTRATFLNIKTELEAAGASFKDVVKMNTYIVNYKPDDIKIFRAVRKELLGEVNMPASTVVGVQSLVGTDKLIEIEAIAVIQTNK